MAAGLIYDPQVGCRSEVSAAFDGRITCEGGSETSLQQKAKEQAERVNCQLLGMVSMCGTKKNQEGQPGFCSVSHFSTSTNSLRHYEL